MRCFSSNSSSSSSSSKRKQRKLLTDSSSSAASTSSAGTAVAAAGSSTAHSGKMTRTRSAPPSFLNVGGTCSPLLSKAAKSKDQQQQQKDAAAAGSAAGSCSSPLVSHSATLPSGYNSLGGLRREAVFRGEPMPLPTPESCGLAPEPPRPFSFPSPLLQPSGGAAAAAPSVTPSLPPTLPPSVPSVQLPRPPSSAPVACPPPAAHLRFSPDTSCIGEGGNGPAFLCSVLVDGTAAKPNETDALLVRLLDPSMQQDSKAWMEELKVMAALRHPNLSKVLGFSFTSEEKLVVYESQANGSLDRLLYGRTRNRPPLDWCTRFRIALDAATGLAYLLEKSPNKLVYKDFRTFNIHVDADHRAKLVGYGFTRRDVDSDSLMVAAYAAPELISGESAISDKCITWSFGIVLLEVLTGRQNRDEIFPPEQQDLVKWTAPYLVDDKKLFLVVDPELKGMYTSKAVAGVASLARQCLQPEAALRPSMAEVVQKLEPLVATKLEELVQQNAFEKSSSRSGDRKPLIEALKDEGCSPWCSPVQSPSRLAVRSTFSVQGSIQKKLATKLVRTLCTSAATYE